MKQEAHCFVHLALGMERGSGGKSMLYVLSAMHVNALKNPTADMTKLPLFETDRSTPEGLRLLRERKRSKTKLLRSHLDWHPRIADTGASLANSISWIAKSKNS